MKKIIGIDIDGVLTDERHPNDNIWHDRLCQYLGEQKERVKDSYYFTEAYELPVDIINDFLKEHVANIYREVNPATGALETLEMLEQNDFEIHLITARNEKYQELTRKWLAKHKIPYTTLTHEDTKAPLAVTKNIKLFIEDNAETTRELLENKIPVLLINKYHNRYLDVPGLIRVNNWQEIKKYIIEYFELTI